MSYQKQNFTKGQVLTAEHLNNIEDGLAQIEQSFEDAKNSGQFDGQAGNNILTGGKRINRISLSEPVVCYSSGTSASFLLYEGELAGGNTYTVSLNEITSNISDTNATYWLYMVEFNDSTPTVYHHNKTLAAIPYSFTAHKNTNKIVVYVCVGYNLAATETIELACHGFELWLGNVFLDYKYFPPEGKMTTQNIENVIVGGSNEYIINGELLEAATVTSRNYTSGTSESELSCSFLISSLTDIAEGDKLRFMWDDIVLDFSANITSIKYQIAKYNSSGSVFDYAYLDDEGRYTVQANTAKIELYATVRYTNLSSGRWTNCTINGLVITRGGDLYLNEKAIRLKSVDKINRDKLTPNDSYFANGVIRRCYNPYKNKTSESEALVGQLHCHSKFKNDSGEWVYYANSDEGLCKVHADNGYDFIAITDYSHNGVVTEAPSNTHGLIWLGDSQESSVYGNSGNVGQHMCIFHSQQVYALADNMSPEAVARKVTADGCSCSLAHPSWTELYQTPEKINKIFDKIRFCECYTGLSELQGEVQHPDGKSSDYAWEIMLDNGCLTWGIAVNDAHTGSNGDRGITAGCVKVFCNEKTRLSIWENLCKGNFISCSEVNTEIPNISFVDGVFTIGLTDNGARVQFLKEGGEVMHSGTGSTSYTLTGNEQYVRAVITLSNGYKIWTQPIINVFSTDIY